MEVKTGALGAVTRTGETEELGIELNTNLAMVLVRTICTKWEPISPNRVGWKIT